MKQRHQSYIVFLFLSIVLLLTKYATFSTYNGADDLHYALLGSKALTHGYNPFLPYDGYAGRIIPILWQALWFKVFGINDLTIQLPSLTALILLSYVICFKGGIPEKPVFVALTAALVYFNPVVFTSTLGNMPDVYVALIACLIFLIIKKNMGSRSLTSDILAGISVGMLLTIGLWVKETIVFVYVSTLITLVVFRKGMHTSFLTAIAITVIAGCASWALLYYAETGDVFFRYKQLVHTAYFNACSYERLPAAVSLRRLTIMMPVVFSQSGFFPVLFTGVFLFYRTSKRKGNTPTIRFYHISFVVILLTALYFPLSIKPFVPLCHENRQFLFVLPLAVLLYMTALDGVCHSGKKDRQLFFGVSSALLLLSVIINCLTALYNKWIMVDESLLAICFATMVIADGKYVWICTGIVIPILLWMSVAYPLYRAPHGGYSDLKDMQRSIGKDRSLPKDFYYFTDHDTQMHYEAADKFNASAEYISLDTTDPGLIPFRQYQPEEMFSNDSAFRPGWMVINPDYTPMYPAQLDAIYALLKHLEIQKGDVRAYRLSSAVQLQAILGIVNHVKPLQQSPCGCAPRGPK